MPLIVESIQGIRVHTISRARYYDLLKYLKSSPTQVTVVYFGVTCGFYIISSRKPRVFSIDMTSSPDNLVKCSKL